MVKKTCLFVGAVLLLSGCNVFTDLEAIRGDGGGCDVSANPCEGCTPANACGGCGVLRDPVGGACGTCDSGVFECEGEGGETACVGDLGEAAKNACGGCEVLDSAPGDGCGTCESGELECDRGNLVCRGDLGEVALNVCGGCGEPTNPVDGECGTCGTGTFECNTATLDTVCVGDAGEGVLNACGGCEELSDTEGDPCGQCGEFRCNQETKALDCLDVPAPVWFRDRDGDSFGNPEDSQTACDQPEGFVDNGDDCLDETVEAVDPATINPDAEEVAGDGRDNNCDGFVRLLPATLQMGSPLDEPGRRNDETQHPVTLTRTIEVSIDEVTRGLYDAVTSRTPTTDANCAGPECAVSCLNWYESLAFLNELSRQHGVEACYTLEDCEGTPGAGSCTGNACSNEDAFNCDTITFAGLDCAGFRLPTEAEWEFFTRGNTTTAYFTGQVTGSGCNESRVAEMGQYCGNAGDRIHNVGEKRPNRFGLFDTSGNVSEWVSDNYAIFNADPVTDPLGPELGEQKVHRGGSFRDQADFCRSASRDKVEPICRNRTIGLRAVRTILSAE